MDFTECTREVWAIFSDAVEGEVDRPVLAWDGTGAAQILGETGLTPAKDARGFLRLALVPSRKITSPAKTAPIRLPDMRTAEMASWRDPR